jgi:drug/metabolite transporter superfamily protein YnfA
VTARSIALRFDVLGAGVCLVGVVVIMYAR